MVRLWHIGTLLQCCLIILSMAACSSSDSDKDTNDRVMGETFIIGKDGDGAVCAATRDKLKAAYDASSKNDTDGISEALQGGTQLARGERVLVIDSDVGSGFNEGVDMRVRILSGQDAHLACWAWEKTMHLQRIH